MEREQLKEKIPETLKTVTFTFKTKHPRYITRNYVRDCNTVKNYYIFRRTNHATNFALCPTVLSFASKSVM